MKKSKHAEIRLQQRGIKTSHIQLILKYGVVKSKSGGAYEYFIPKSSIDKIRLEFKQKLQDLDKISKSNKTVLLKDNTIITAYNAR